MKETEQRQMDADLFDLLWQMEQILKNYCRHLAAHDDGHWLETEPSDEPF